MSKISITIDNKTVEVEQNRTVLEACDEMGIKIPTLCYSKALPPYGACRLCLVEIEQRGRSRLRASCTYKVLDGLIVRTDTENVRKTRTIMAELLLAR
jgi:bidirectional [NiFe] hydrogenase diaphorase subunit